MSCEFRIEEKIAVFLNISSIKEYFGFMEFNSYLARFAVLCINGYISTVYPFEEKWLINAKKSNFGLLKQVYLISKIYYIIKISNHIIIFSLPEQILSFWRKYIKNKVLC